MSARVCELCGRYLLAGPHTISVSVDGRTLIRFTVCLTHREELADSVLRAAALALAAAGADTP